MKILITFGTTPQQIPNDIHPQNVVAIPLMEGSAHFLSAFDIDGNLLSQKAINPGEAMLFDFPIEMDLQRNKDALVKEIDALKKENAALRMEIIKTPAVGDIMNPNRNWKNPPGGING